MGDEAYALGEQIDEFTKAIEAREARLAAAARAEEEARAAAEANAVAAVAARESAALKVGLIGHWKFDDGAGTAAKDSSGKGHHGRVMGGAKWVQGKRGGALEFDGSDGRVELPQGFADFTKGLTFAVWAKPVHNPGNWHRFIELADAGTRCNVLFAREGKSSDLKFEVYQGAGGRRKKGVTAHSAIEQGVWQHFAVTMDAAGEAVLYKNGVEVAKGRSGLPKNVRRTLNYIGKSVFEHDGRYEGLMDDVRIYARGLPSDEIRMLFEGPKPAPGAAPTKGLIGHWKFDDGGGTVARDSSGKDNHGAVHGGAKWTQGKRGGALEFDGTDDYVAIANEANFDITGNITVAAWIKVASFTKKWQVIITKGGRCWRLQRDGGRRNLEWACTGLSHNGPGNVHGRVAVNDGRWHHVAGVYDGTETYLYVDGKVDASARTSGSILTNDYKVYIGDDAQGGGRYFHGLIDDVRVYDRALSSDEIGMLVKGPRPAPGAAPTEGLIGYWKFDEPAGAATAKDETGSNNGTNVGVTTGAPGKKGRAYSFDGGGDSVSVGTWDVPSFTLDQWIKWEGGAGIRTIVSKGGRWDLWIEEGNLRLRRNGSLSTFGNYRPPVGVWVRLTVTYDGTNAILYVNGAHEGEGKFSMAGATGATVKIGEQTDGGGCFNGLIDEVRVHDRALSADEVKALFEGRGAAPGPGSTEGLVCHWKFDEPAGAGTAVDSSGGGHNGNNRNVTTGLPGRVGSCYKFDGSSSHVEVPSLGLTFTKATFAVWVNIDEIQQNNDSIIHTDDYEGGSVHYMFGGSRSVYFCVQGCGKPRSKTVFTADDIGKWVHVAATYDSTVSPPITHYRNGLPDGTGGKKGRTLDFTSPSDIGSLDTSRWFKGRMDDFRIYDRALSAEEMKALFEGRTAAPGPAPAGGLVGHWKFDDGTGTVAKDASGTGSDGTVKGARWTAGKLGDALDFDGVRAGVDCPVPAGLTLAEATVAFWARVPSAGWKPWRDWWELGTAKGAI
ncbi:MAG: LamG domain-containing protein, partial [Planctomycetota bacterium]